MNKFFRSEEQTLETVTECKFTLIERLKILLGAVVQVKVRITIPTPDPIESYNGASNVKLISQSKSTFKKDKPDYGYECPV